MGAHFNVARAKTMIEMLVASHGGLPFLFPLWTAVLRQDAVAQGESVCGTDSP